MPRIVKKRIVIRLKDRPSAKLVLDQLMKTGQYDAHFQPNGITVLAHKPSCQTEVKHVQKAVKSVHSYRTLKTRAGKLSRQLVPLVRMAQRQNVTLRISATTRHAGDCASLSGVFIRKQDPTPVK